MFLPTSLPGLAGVPAPSQFQSPFPSSFGDASLQALGGYSAANFASQGASAWAIGSQISMVIKANVQGDLRSDWIPQLMREDSETGALMGFFASIHFPDSTDPLALEKAMVNTGFDVAGGIVSAVPVYGQIIAAVLDVAQFFYNLFRVEDPAARLPLVPWAEYSQGADEDRVKAVLFPTMNSTDWTRLFWPLLDHSTGWRMFETDEGDQTRAWGTFSEQGALRYATNAPGSDGAGLGFMPGTQKMNDVVQLVICGKYCGPTSRTDAITAVGNFYPATAQICTGLWEQVMKPGNPDMYKVRAGELNDEWDAYYDAMRQSFAAEWNWRWAKGYSGDHREECVNLGKVQEPVLLSGQNRITLEGINSRWIWPGMTRKTGNWQPDPDDGRPSCVPKDDRSGEGWWDKGWKSDIHYQAGAHWPPDRCYYGNVPSAQRTASYKYLDNAVIQPACRALRDAQHRALYRTEICAYVRPRDVGGLTQYAAFADRSPGIDGFNGTFGEQLIERCEHAREVLLTKDLRYKVRLIDVDAIDPPFAARLRASGVTENSWKHSTMRLSAGAELGDAEPIPGSDGPAGGSPFQVVGDLSGGGGGGLLLGAAALAAFAALKR